MDPSQDELFGSTETQTVHETPDATAQLDSVSTTPVSEDEVTDSPVDFELIIEEPPTYDKSADGSVVNDARVRGWLSSFYSACTGVDPGLIEGVDVGALNKSTHDLGWLTGGLLGAAIGWLVGRVYGDITGGRAVKKNVDALGSGALARYIGG